MSIKIAILKKFGTALLQLSQIKYQVKYYGVPEKPPPFFQLPKFVKSINQPASATNVYHLDDMVVPVFCFNTPVNLNKPLVPVFSLRKWFLFIQQETMFGRKHHVTPNFVPLQNLINEGVVGIAGDQYGMKQRSRSLLTQLPSRQEMEMDYAQWSKSTNYKHGGSRKSPISDGGAGIQGGNGKGEASCWGAKVNLAELKLDSKTKYRWLLRKDTLIEMEDFQSNSFRFLPPLTDSSVSGGGTVDRFVESGEPAAAETVSEGRPQSQTEAGFLRPVKQISGGTLQKLRHGRMRSLFNKVVF